MIYEYKCSLCLHGWEEDQGIRDAAIDDCPKCGGKTAVRQCSGGAGFALKGAGWARDGYAAAAVPVASGK